VNRASPKPLASDADEGAHLRALAARRVHGGISQRKAQGSHYTPPELVGYALAEATRGWKPSSDSWRLIDPACGSGNFLVAAARSLSRRLHEPMAAFLATRVHGFDIDPVAVKLARSALLELLPPRTSAATRILVRKAIAKNIVVADSLAIESPECYDLILGNPPFLNQLEKGTVASRAEAARIATATRGAVRRYADLATAFLLWGLGRLAPRGRLAFVMPQSFLSTADARAARDASITLASLRSIWSSDTSMFEDASVRVCAVAFERGKPRAVRRAFGAGFATLKGQGAHPNHGDESWAPLLAEGFGAPRIEMTPVAGAVADIATATADFRDQYYGLRDAIEEDGSGPRLATTRHIDLCSCTWGDCEVRVLGERFTRPTIAPARVVGRKGMDGWLEARLVPKILVATQTRVIEAFVDERGEYAPLVPIISVFPRVGTDLWQLAAAIASPVVAARALALYAGSALGAGAIKLSARQLLAMPLPSDVRAWKRSATCLRARDFEGFARASCEAHALSAKETRDVLRFWMARL
jgi:tRNA1(Val) A37 N6-methylase TrmN6